MKSKLIIYFLVMMSFDSFSEIIKDDNFITNKNIFSYSEACEFFTKRNNPLIDFHSVTEISCMGQIFPVAKFCEEKEMMNDFYSRALVIKDKKEVHCLSSKRVVIKYKCEGDKDKYCKASEEGCFYFKEKLAKKLILAHHSLTSQNLNCYFDSKTGSDIISEELNDKLSE